MLEAGVVLYALEMLEGMGRVLRCMLEAVEGELCLLEVPEVMHRVLLCLLEVLEVPEGPEMTRYVLLCMLEALEVMRCVLLYSGGCGGWALFAGGAGRDALRATLQARGRGG